MNTIFPSIYRMPLLAGLAVWMLTQTGWAQRPQDNWYLEATWNKGAEGMTVTNGGLSAPYGVAIGPDGRIYVGDEGYGCIQVYLPDGTYSFSITNGFGGGLAFSQPRGMITDQTGNLYVADQGSNCVFIFTANGAFVRKIGSGTGSGDGQLSGVIDVAIARNGNVYVLETTNSRVSVFDSEGNYVRTWGQAGPLDGQLNGPTSIAMSPDDLVCVTQCPANVADQDLKEFSADGVFLRKLSFLGMQEIYLSSSLVYGPTSVRVDDSGVVFIIQSGHWSFGYGPDPNATNDKYWNWFALTSDGTTVGANRMVFGSGEYSHNYLKGNHPGVGRDGTMVVCGSNDRNLLVFRRAFRGQWAPPRNAIPMPAVRGVHQRPNSPLVDIDYQVTDADDPSIYAAMLVFKNASQSLSNCIARLTLVEETAANLGPGIAANQPHRVTWNAGADWGVNLGDYRVAILARDSRPGLLDIHYLNLPAGSGLPALKISRSPLNTNDFMQVWWWLLATNDVAITLSSNRIYGASGTYMGKVLCEREKTTADGRAYLCEKMRLRQATVEEVQWARQATLPVGTTPSQWPPARSVGGRPMAVNEYGFDTGDWGEEAWWVVPLD